MIASFQFANARFFPKNRCEAGGRKVTSHKENTIWIVSWGYEASTWKNDKRKKNDNAWKHHLIDIGFFRQPHLGELTRGLWWFSPNNSCSPAAVLAHRQEAIRHLSSPGSVSKQVHSVWGRRDMQRFEWIPDEFDRKSAGNSLWVSKPGCSL